MSSRRSAAISSPCTPIAAPRCAPSRSPSCSPTSASPRPHSRPYTSTDNPYSEAQFRTLKYRPDFPARFDSLEQAREFCRSFFRWYNHEHRHSGIGLMTPATVHHGRAKQAHAARQAVLAAAYAANPERFVRKAPEPPTLPRAAWINKPDSEEVAH